MKALIQTIGLLTILWGSSLPLAWPMVSGKALAAAVKAAPKNPNLQKLFRRGMDAYESKSFDDAVDLFTQLLQKQPDSIPAKIQLARTLYQLKRFPEAYKLFLQIEDVNILEPDPSYEYGQSAFRSNDYANALKAFRNVPTGHPMFDLAGYYGGISAFKLGDYQLALDLFEQAVVLPSKLLKSQKLYQKEAERLLIQKQKQEVQSSIPPNSPNAKPGAAPAPAEPPEPPPPYRRLIAERRLSIIPKIANQTHQTVDNRSSNHDIRSGLLDLRLGADKNSNSAKGPHWILQTAFAVKSIEGASSEILVAPDARAEQENFVIRKNAPRSVISFDLDTGAEWAIATGTSLGLTLGVRGFLPGDPGSNGATIPLFGVFLAQKNNSLETMLKTDFYGLLYDGDFLASNARQLGRIDYLAQNRFRFALQGELSEFAYNVDRVNGPDWQGRIQTEIGYGNEQSFRVALGAFFEITEGQRYHDLPEASVIEFNANAMGALLKSDISLFKSVDLGLEAQVMQRSSAGLSPNNEATIAALHNSFPTFVTNLALSLNIFTGF